MESFFKTLKVEELYRKDYKSEKDFKKSVEKYIHYYNEERHHSMNRYRTPNNKEKEYYDKNINNQVIN